MAQTQNPRCVKGSRNCSKFRRKAKSFGGGGDLPVFWISSEVTGTWVTGSLRDWTRILKLLSTGFTGDSRGMWEPQITNHSPNSKPQKQFSILLRFLKSSDGHNSPEDLYLSQERPNIFSELLIPLRASQEQHYWYPGPDNSLWWGALLCTVGCLAASLASNY